MLLFYTIKGNTKSNGNIFALQERETTIAIAIVGRAITIRGKIKRRNDKSMNETIEIMKQC